MDTFDWGTCHCNLNKELGHDSGSSLLLKQFLITVFHWIWWLINQGVSPLSNLRSGRPTLLTPLLRACNHPFFTVALLIELKWHENRTRTRPTDTQTSLLTSFDQREKRFKMTNRQTTSNFFGWRQRESNTSSLSTDSSYSLCCTNLQNFMPTNRNR